MRIFSKFLTITNLLLLSLPLFAKSGDKSVSNPSFVFQENKGQIHDQNYNSRQDIRFAGTDGHLNFFLKRGGIMYQQTLPIDYKESTDKISGQTTQVPTALSYYRTEVSWVNSNPGMTFSTSDPVQGLMNYYLPSCPDGAMNVKSFSSIQYQNLYPGIDVHWYYEKGGLKYDYYLAPGTDYRTIQLEIKGFSKISIDREGALQIHTPIGILTEAAPLVKQGSKTLPAKWIVSGSNVSFEIEGVSPNEALVIDPAVRIWGTYYGGGSTDMIRAGDTDNQESVFVVGYTNTTTGTLFASTGAHQGTFGGSLQDAIIAKFDSSGNRVWGTYLGGTQSDEALACAVDPNGNLYVTGWTRSSTTNTVFASTNGHQTAHGGGADDVFLLKFNTNGVRLWGTFYGDQNDDVGHACAVDPSGNPFLVGFTKSTMNISTPGAHQVSHAGLGDVIVVKFDTAGVRQWATYYGGPKADRPYACATDHLGNIYFTGITDSITNHSGISTVGSHQANPGGGTKDAFLVKLNGSGIRQWGTFYGGSNIDEGRACATDASGNVYIGGTSYSTNGIASTGAHQTAYYATRDGYVAKFNPAGTRLWSTYIGGGQGDWIGAISTDAANNLFVTGNTTSTDSISTPGAFQTTKVSIQDDAFLMMFDSTGLRLWGTYYGDVDQDASYACPTTPSGHLYIAGTSQAVTNISTPGTHQTTFGGGFGDGFIVRFQVSSVSAPLTVTISSNSPICAGDTLTLTASAPIGTTYQWAGPGGFTANGNPAVLYSATPSYAGIYTVTATLGSNTSTATHLVTIHQLPPVAITPATAVSICQGDSALLTASGAISYIWNTSALTSTISVNSAGTFTVTGTDANGCTSNSAPVVVTVNPIPATPTISGQNTVLVNNSVSLTVSGSTGTYSWWNAFTGGTQFGTGSNYTTPNLTVTTTFYAQAQNLGCTSVRDSFTVSVVSITHAADGIDSDELNIQLFPSPVQAGKEIFLSLKGLQAIQHPIQLSIYSLHGQSLFTETIPASGATTLNHSLNAGTALSTGVYLLEIQYEGKQFIRKFIIE